MPTLLKSIQTIDADSVTIQTIDADSVKRRTLHYTSYSIYLSDNYLSNPLSLCVREVRHTYCHKQYTYLPSDNNFTSNYWFPNIADVTGNNCNIDLCVFNTDVVL